MRGTARRLEETGSSGYLCVDFPSASAPVGLTHPNRTERQTGTQRTALLIAYHYPPVASTGIERTVKHVRYLPDFGYRSRILTTSAFGSDGDGEVLRAWEPLAGYRWLMNAAVRTDRAGSVGRRTDAGAARGLVRLLRRWVMVPDGQITWLPAAAALGWRALRAHPADIIYSTYPPASAHLLGLLLKGLSGVPWVADFRDSWIGDPLDPETLAVPGRRRIERRLERAVIEHADAVIAATEISAGMMAEAYPSAAARIRVITNGFDPEDAMGEEETPSGGNRARRLEIAHTGSFGLSHPERSPLPLFAALQSLLGENAGWTQRIRLTLAGRLTVSETEAAAPLAKAGIVDLRGAISRRDSLALQRSAGALLLLDHKRTGLSSNVPGKLYEYMAAARPILALCGEGMVARMVDMQAGLRTTPDDPAAIRQMLVDAYDRFERGALTSDIPAEKLRLFHRRELTRQLACCFDDVVKGRSAAAGTAMVWRAG